MIKKGINYLIFSHFWISLGAVGLLIGNYKILKIDVNPLYLALTFFATLFPSLTAAKLDPIKSLKYE